MLLAPPYQPVGNAPRTARIADILFARPGLFQIVRTIAARREKIDLKDEHILVRRLDHMLERRVRHQPAIPIPMPVDLDRRQSRRQGAGRHDMPRVDPVGAGIEIAEIARLDRDRADRKPDIARVEPIPVDQPVERRDQRRRVIIADRGRRLPLGESGGGMRGTKNPGTPKLATRAAAPRCTHSRTASLSTTGSEGSADDTPSQKARIFPTASSRGLPAMMAALIAPIEIPATQSSSIPRSISAS